MPAYTRGPLPARVYWTRRLLLLGTAVALVVAIGHWLGTGSDGAGGQRAQEVAQTGPTDLPSTHATHHQGTRHGGKPHHEHTSAPPAPTGPCADSDVSVTPSVPHPVAGRGVTIRLDLRTLATPACTWTVSPDTLTLKITSGADLIWTSRQCPRTIPTKDVVVRRDTSRVVHLTWDARRSDDSCSRITDWALPGYYHLAAAALAGEPHDVQFRLGVPSAPEVTQTVTAHPHHHRHKHRHAD